MRKLLNAGDMRHRVAIQERVETQNENTGAISWTWQTVNDERGNWSSVPAHKMPLSAREFEAAAATQDEVSTRWVMRYMPGVTAKMRLVNDEMAYDIKGVLEDLNTGQDYMMLSCSAGVNAG
jgi:SPP1 family predicted phage head-tail adaptor